MSILANFYFFGICTVFLHSLDAHRINLCSHQCINIGDKRLKNTLQNISIWNESSQLASVLMLGEKIGTFRYTQAHLVTLKQLLAILLAGSSLRSAMGKLT